MYPCITTAYVYTAYYTVLHAMLCYRCGSQYGGIRLLSRGPISARVFCAPSVETSTYSYLASNSMLLFFGRITQKRVITLIIH